MTEKTLKELKSEVDDLHPLLGELLPLLPNITNIEYTHGPDEKGADFILERKDETLDRRENIGIIAKLGKIGSNFNDIERQIDECKASRLVFGGKKKVYLDEIWVVNNDNITEGAKGKIQRKFKGTKIKFISGSDLNKLINTRLPSYWLGINPSVGSYLNDLRQTTIDHDNALSLLSLDKRAIYIEQDVYRVPRYGFSKKDYKSKVRVDIFEEIQTQKAILIEGGMGAGKSKLLRRIITHYTEYEIFNETKIVPILATYRELINDFDLDLEKLKSSRISEDSIVNFKDSEFLFLIDGVDEMQQDLEDQLSILSDIVAQADQTENTRVVFSSRYIEGLNEENNSSLGLPVSRFYIPPLSMSKTIEFLKQLCAELNLTARIIEDLKKSDLFKQLPQSPIAAILLAKLINEDPKELPSNLTELYSKYLELILGRWDVDRGLQSQKVYQAIDSIVIRLASLFYDFNLEFMTQSDVLDQISEYLKKRKLNLATDDVYRTIVERCEVISVDTLGNRVYFKHRTFIEYFYAKKLLLKGGLEISPQIFEFYRINVAFFYLGLRRDDPDLLNKVISIKPETEVQKWLKVVNLGNFCLAAYATPYHVITEGIEKAMIEAARIYLDTVSEGNDSPFTIFPRMHLLFILQFVLRDSYSYEFFNDALEEVALRVSGGDYSGIEKAYALFFLNLTFIELKKVESFDFLLEDYAKHLPIELTLAIHHEGDRLASEANMNKTRLMKKQDKKVRRLYESAIQAQKLKELYEIPIKELDKT